MLLPAKKNEKQKKPKRKNQKQKIIVTKKEQIKNA